MSSFLRKPGSALASVSNSATIIDDATPANQRGTMLGIKQIAFKVVSVAGFTLSGAIIAYCGWRFQKTAGQVVLKAVVSGILPGPPALK